MMKFTGAIGTALSAVVLVPTVGLGQHGADATLDSLETALRKTTETLEVLAGIRDTASGGEPISAAVAASVTEAPIGDARMRDEKLMALRTQVGLLQQELDVVEARQFAAPEDAPVAVPPVAPLPASPERGLTLGLNEDAMAAVKNIERPRSHELLVEATDPAVEHPGYSADALLQAQACYRARQFSRGLALLQGDQSAAGLYWRGRCLERLERFEEAKAMYERVAAMEDAGSYAERARANVEFVQWKAGFVQNLPSRKEAKTDE